MMNDRLQAFTNNLGFWLDDRHDLSLKIDVEKSSRDVLVGVILTEEGKRFTSVITPTAAFMLSGWAITRYQSLM
jgi:hypothetical protein